jgi:hypothetical protein
MTAILAAARPIDFGSRLLESVCASDVVQREEGGDMALARVVTFEGVNSERIEELRGEIESGERPAGLNPTEMLVLHDPEGEKSIAILVFDTEEDYTQADAVLDAMPAPDTPGRRTSVGKYEVAIRMTS